VAAAPAGGARRVVIVEDWADAADSLREVLELLGFEASVARSGPESVELCRRLRPHAVVSDIGLPGMTGFEVARALRGDPATAGAILVAVSGYAQDEDRRKAREAGFDALLAKPARRRPRAPLHPPGDLTVATPTVHGPMPCRSKQFRPRR
jgi:CheY-like chemotaxis protein